MPVQLLGDAFACYVGTSDPSEWLLFHQTNRMFIILEGDKLLLFLLTARFTDFPLTLRHLSEAQAASLFPAAPFLV